MPGGRPSTIPGGPGLQSGPDGQSGQRPPRQAGDDQNGGRAGRGQRTGPGGTGRFGGGRADSQMIAYLKRGQGGATGTWPYRPARPRRRECDHAVAHCDDGGHPGAERRPADQRTGAAATAATTAGGSVADDPGSG
ncbi:Uncharacterised protein [Mycobacterium tuberculosis]|nr:Uncharacterised protein [Mycobacterium tuberculosis]